MRLIEFADVKPYVLSAGGAAYFLKQLERVWPHEDVEYVLGVNKPAPNKQKKPEVL